MTSSDILFQILTTISGAFAGVVTSLYFFRAQQKTDFQNLLSRLGLFETRHTQEGTSLNAQLSSVDRVVDMVRQELRSISTNIEYIKTATDVSKMINLNTALSELRSSHNKLSTEVSNIPSKIVEGFKEQQERFVKDIREEFDRTVERSKITLKETLARELVTLVPSTRERNTIIEKLIELSGYAMMTMGSYQMKVVEREAVNAVDKTSATVSGSLAELQVSFSGLKTKVDEVVLALTPPSPPADPS